MPSCGPSKPCQAAAALPLPRAALLLPPLRAPAMLSRLFDIARRQRGPLLFPPRPLQPGLCPWLGSVRAALPSGDCLSSCSSWSATLRFFLPRSQPAPSQAQAQAPASSQRSPQRALGWKEREDEATSRRRAEFSSEVRRNGVLCLPTPHLPFPPPVGLFAFPVSFQNSPQRGEGCDMGPRRMREAIPNHR